MNAERCTVRVRVNEGSNVGALVLLAPKECTVEDLKALLFKNHKIPLEVQTWFRDEKQSLGLLKDDSILEKDNSLCLYVRPMALCKENVRRSDFERWHEEITNTDAYPSAVKETMRVDRITVQQRNTQPSAPKNYQQQTVAVKTVPVVRGQRRAPKREVTIVSDTCHLCGETPAMHCFTCEEKQSVLCANCSGVIHGDSVDHDVVALEDTIPKSIQGGV